MCNEGPPHPVDYRISVSNGVGFGESIRSGQINWTIVVTSGQSLMNICGSSSCKRETGFMVVGFTNYTPGWFRNRACYWVTGALRSQGSGLLCRKASTVWGDGSIRY